MYYEVYGRKWGDTELGTESGEITWSAEFGSNFQFDGGDTQADFDLALQAAFDAWETVSDVNFTHVTPGDTTKVVDLDIVVGAIDGKPYGTVGLASWGGGSSVTWGLVTFDEAEDWAPYGDGGIDFYAVALHEIGHVLGLAHYIPETGDPPQIMNPKISVDDLQSGDIAGIRYLYGAGDGMVTETPEEPDTPDVTLASEDSGSGGGGAIGAVVALLSLVFGMLFSGGGAAIALAAGSVGRGSDDNAPDTPEDVDAAVDLADLIPVTEFGSHAVWVDDFGNFMDHPEHDHGAGCGCGHCCGADDEFFYA